VGKSARKRLEGRVAVVTGSSRGIGRAIALLFAREGAKVVVNYRTQRAKAREVVDQIRDAGGQAEAFQADVGDKRAVDRMIEAAVEAFGRVDILVNNAGLLRGGGIPLVELTDADFDAMMNTNVRGLLYCTQAVVPHMMRQRYGKIVNMSSVGGLGTSLRSASHLYGATKGAVNLLTKRFALELGPHGINVNAIAPGLIRTDMPRGDKSAQEWAARMQQSAASTLLRRVGEPMDIASVALFLASEEASFITGQVLAVDGGRMNFITHSL
jgi:3-oxoacyl-[acyl-carrier protein] reductase